jgi:hypothetical protein
MIVLVCAIVWRYLTHRSKGYFVRISMALLVLKGGGGGGGVLAEIFTIETIARIIIQWLGKWLLCCIPGVQ